MNLDPRNKSLLDYAINYFNRLSPKYIAYYSDIGANLCIYMQDRNYGFTVNYYCPYYTVFTVNVLEYIFSILKTQLKSLEIEKQCKYLSSEVDRYTAEAKRTSKSTKACNELFAEISHDKLQKVYAQYKALNNKLENSLIGKEYKIGILLHIHSLGYIFKVEDLSKRIYSLAPMDCEFLGIQYEERLIITYKENTYLCGL